MPNRHKDGLGLNDSLEIVPSEDKHTFEIWTKSLPGQQETPRTLVSKINFQNGPRQEVGVNGITTEVLCTVLELYLEHVNKGEWATREGSLCYTKIQEARMWAAERAKSRARRGVLGTKNV